MVKMFRKQLYAILGAPKGPQTSLCLSCYAFRVAREDTPGAASSAGFGLSEELLEDLRHVVALSLIHI
eukprot:7425704-Alexandrium_andersonii.AAC.1